MVDFDGDAANGSEMYIELYNSNYLRGFDVTTNVRSVGSGWPGGVITHSAPPEPVWDNDAPMRNEAMVDGLHLA